MRLAISYDCQEAVRSHYRVTGDKNQSPYEGHFHILARVVRTLAVDSAGTPVSSFRLAVEPLRLEDLMTAHQIMRTSGALQPHHSLPLVLTFVKANKMHKPVRCSHRSVVVTYTSAESI